MNDSPAGDASMIHQIRLHGPWSVEVALPQDAHRAALIAESGLPGPDQRTTFLPRFKFPFDECRADELTRGLFDRFPPLDGHPLPVYFRRPFNWPHPADPAETTQIAVETELALEQVWLNGQPLQFTAGRTIPIQAVLQRHNQFLLEWCPRITDRLLPIRQVSLQIFR